MLIAAAFLIMLLTDAASAQRPSTLNMTCAQARGFVASSGGVVMSTGQHTFQRFVASPGYCALGEHAETGWAPTLDARRCRVGYYCELGTPFQDDDEWFE